MIWYTYTSSTQALYRSHILPANFKNQTPKISFKIPLRISVFYINPFILVSKIVSLLRKPNDYVQRKV